MEPARSGTRNIVTTGIPWLLIRNPLHVYYVPVFIIIFVKNGHRNGPITYL